jgi:hypothetical protein
MPSFFLDTETLMQQIPMLFVQLTLPFLQFTGIMVSRTFVYTLFCRQDTSPASMDPG